MLKQSDFFAVVMFVLVGVAIVSVALDNKAVQITSLVCTVLFYLFADLISLFREKKLQDESRKEKDLQAQIDVLKTELNRIGLKLLNR